MTQVEQQLPLDPSSAATARALVAELGPEMASDALFRLRLVVTELVANCVKHGGTTGTISLHASRRDGRIHIRVSCPKGLSNPRVRAPEERSGSGGLGLYMVDALALRWGVEEDPTGSDTAVWAELGVDSKPAG